MENEKAKKLTRKEIRKAIEDKVKKGLALNEEEAKAFEMAMKEMKKPIVFKDSDIVLAEREVDVRRLSPESYRQLEFRMGTAEIATLRSIDASLVDIMRLLMLTLKKLGVDDVQAELAKLYEELSNKIKANSKA